MTDPTADPTLDSSDDSSEQVHFSESIRDKLIDAQTPGFQAEFDPEEAERAGAFPEDALSEADALQSVHDLPDALTEKSISQFSDSKVLNTHWPRLNPVTLVSSTSKDKES